jgi:hypothetical protein
MIGFCQSTSGASDSAAATNSPTCLRMAVTGPVEVPGPAPGSGTMQPSPGGAWSKNWPAFAKGFSRCRSRGVLLKLDTGFEQILCECRAKLKRQLPRCPAEGCDGPQNHRIYPLIALPPADKPPCESHDNLNLP